MNVTTPDDWNNTNPWDVVRADNRNVGFDWTVPVTIVGVTVIVASVVGIVTASFVVRKKRRENSRRTNSGNEAAPESHRTKNSTETNNGNGAPPQSPSRPENDKGDKISNTPKNKKEDEEIEYSDFSESESEAGSVKSQSSGLESIPNSNLVVRKVGDIISVSLLAEEEKKVRGYQVAEDYGHATDKSDSFKGLVH